MVCRRSVQATTLPAASSLCSQSLPESVTSADYNNKCNTRINRPHTNQSAKWSHHNKYHTEVSMRFYSHLTLFEKFLEQNLLLGKGLVPSLPPLGPAPPPSPERLREIWAKKPPETTTGTPITATRLEGNTTSQKQYHPVTYCLFYYTIDLDMETRQPVRLFLHLVPKL